MSLCGGARRRTPKKQAIDDAIEDINIKIGFLDQAGLLQAAVSVSDAANELQAIVASARLGPFDDTVKALAAPRRSCSTCKGRSARWKRSPRRGAEQPAGRCHGARNGGRSTAGALKPSASTNFATLQQEYRASTTPARRGSTSRARYTFFVNHLTKFRSRYEAVGRASGFPGNSSASFMASRAASISARICTTVTR